ncbi:MAG: MBL fold metallo-hydrolase [Chloroflexota bacterium]
MKLQLIRNATLRINYADHLFVIDPYLADKQTLPSYAGKSKNPLVDLPCPPEAVIADAEMVIVSHLHGDHFDASAQNLLPKALPIFCQPGDEGQIQEKGFEAVTPIEDQINWQGLEITRKPGQHGVEADVLALLGNVSGFVFQAPGEPKVYWAGDTIWYDPVAQVIEQHQPDIIVTHSCGAVWGDSEPIVMDAAQTIQVCQAAPNSIVIAVHMEALDHATVSREMLREQADAAGIAADKLLIPSDGETLTF